MSVLIKGMEMPKDGCHHMICIYADGTVSTGGRVYMAVPIPPHGRLIDADELGLIDFEIVMCDGNYKKGLGMLAKKIEDAPTVIPADK